MTFDLTGTPGVTDEERHRQVDRCPDSDSSMKDCGVSHLEALQDLLSDWGFKCELNDRGTWPRLRLYGPYDTDSAVAEFDHNILVVPHADDWWFAWPWSEAITPVTDVLTAAGRIADELGWAPHKRRRETRARDYQTPELRKQTTEPEASEGMNADAGN